MSTEFFLKILKELDKRNKLTLLAVDEVLNHN